MTTRLFSPRFNLWSWFLRRKKPHLFLFHHRLHPFQYLLLLQFLCHPLRPHRRENLHRKARSRSKPRFVLFKFWINHCKSVKKHTLAKACLFFLSFGWIVFSFLFWMNSIFESFLRTNNWLFVFSICSYFCRILFQQQPS